MLTKKEQKEHEKLQRLILTQPHKATPKQVTRAFDLLRKANASGNQER